MTLSAHRRANRNATLVSRHVVPVRAHLWRQREGAFDGDSARRFLRVHSPDPLRVFDVYSSEVNWAYVAEKLNAMSRSERAAVQW